MYPSERRVDGSTFYSLAGKIMGGGSSVNVMSVIRPIKADMDAWAAAGNPSWSWEHVLPVLKRLENDQDNPDSPDHGHGGPLYFERHYLFGQEVPRAVQVFMDAARELGLPRGDVNDPEPLGSVHVALQHQGRHAAVHHGGVPGGAPGAGPISPSSPRRRWSRFPCRATA